MEFVLADQVANVLAENERLTRVNHELSQKLLQAGLDHPRENKQDEIYRLKAELLQDEDARHVREDSGWMCPICRSCYSLEDGARYLTRSQTCGCPDMPAPIRELRVARHKEVPEGPNTCLVNLDPEINTVAILLYQCVTGKRFGYVWGTEMNVWVHRAQFIVGALRAKELITQ